MACNRYVFSNLHTPRFFFIAVLGWLGLANAASQESPTTGSSSGGLLLNELLASNRSGLRDDNGINSDWIELHNAGSQERRLQGFSLTDDVDDLGKWTFPDIGISSRGHLLVWMSGNKSEPSFASFTGHSILSIHVKISRFLKKLAGISRPIRL